MKIHTLNNIRIKTSITGPEHYLPYNGSIESHWLNVEVFIETIPSNLLKDVLLRETASTRRKNWQEIKSKKIKSILNFADEILKNKIYSASGFNEKTFFSKKEGFRTSLIIFIFYDQSSDALEFSLTRVREELMDTKKGPRSKGALERNQWSKINLSRDEENELRKFFGLSLT